MKKSLLLLTLVWLGMVTIAQTPQAFKYQAVARDTSGNVLSSRAMAFKISLLQGGPSGTVLYRERQTTMTNSFGLANLDIGKGTPQFGTFSNINWSAGPIFLKIEMDPDGGYAYINMGTSELLSVPFALFAKGSLGTTALADNDGDTKVQVEKTPDEDIIRFDLGGTEKMVLSNKRLELTNMNNNILLGKNSGFLNTNGYSNVSIGTGTLYNTTNQSQLVALGDSALFNNGIGASGPFLANKNIAIGAKALFSNTTGALNTATGFQALYSNITGSHNTAYGNGALYNNTDGFSNTAYGNEALYSNTTGGPNVAIGYQALYSKTTGSSNTAIGSWALYKNITGFGNIAIGHGAGYWETENMRLYIDNQSRSQQGERDQALIYGVFNSNPDNQQLTINGKVGIRTSSPTVELEVNGWTKTGGLEAIGSITAGGSLTVGGWTTTKVLQITGGSDIAEPFPVDGLLPLGSVVVIDENNPGHLIVSKEQYNKRVAGVVSGAGGIQPGLTLSKEGVIEGNQNIALIGRVYVLATTENGAIKPGDMLTTSNTPGHAMKATDLNQCDGAVIGKAMSSLEKGEGLVLILVNLQ